MPTRGWELLAGSILAYFEIKQGYRNKSKILALMLPKIGLLLIEDKKSNDLPAIIDQFENMEDKKLVSEILFDELSSDDPQLNV